MGCKWRQEEQQQQQQQQQPIGSVYNMIYCYLLKWSRNSCTELSTTQNLQASSGSVSSLGCHWHSKSVVRWNSISCAPFSGGIWCSRIGGRAMPPSVPLAWAWGMRHRRWSKQSPLKEPAENPVRSSLSLPNPLPLASFWRSHQGLRNCTILGGSSQLASG